jgi:mannonate dehydratase
VEAAGLRVWNIGNSSVHNMEEVTLNLPGRDEKIEEYKQYLRNLARAGITYTTYAHMGNGIWSTEREPGRGGASARAFDLAKAEKGSWGGKDFRGPLTHGREYSKEEIWANYTYFIQAVVPVAEEVGVRIGIHPDDPPVPVLGGVPRCVFGNFDGYVRALSIANSANVGVCLCCGTWMEGGKLMGKTVLGAIDYFGRRGKLWKIHYRNITAPLPHFVETFVDDGFMDMYEIMRALKKVDFRGAVIPDHVPEVVGGPRVGAAYSLAYMKAHLDRATAEGRRR